MTSIFNDVAAKELHLGVDEERINKLLNSDGKSK
jgi:hypothetical protein